MKHYDNYKDDCSDVPFTKFKIIVPTIEDKKELLDAFEHIHDTWGDGGIDTGFVTVNQLAHMYEEHPNSMCNIIVDKELFEKL